MAELLRVENINKSYVSGSTWGGIKTQVLKNISFAFNKGESYGLLGASGCGKSTLARLILALEKPDSGKIFIDGQDIFSLKTKELKQLRKKIQPVFQDPYASFNPRMTIEEVLSEPFLIHGEKPITANLKKLLCQVGLAETSLAKYPHEFSGGQRQRIAIARALALKPKLIVADEPLSSLDVSVQAQILNLFADIKEEYGLSLIFISHDFALCKFLCTRAAVMDKGVIAEEGPAEKVILHPKSIAAQTLLKAVLPLGAQGGGNV